MSDEELDGLFRKSVERFNHPFEPEAWQAMAQKLDQAQVRAPWYKRLLPLLLLPLLPLLLLITLKTDEKPAPAPDNTPAAVVAESQEAGAVLPQHPVAAAKKQRITGTATAGAANNALAQRIPPKPGQAEAALQKKQRALAEAVEPPAPGKGSQPVYAQPVKEQESYIRPKPVRLSSNTASNFETLQAEQLTLTLPGALAEQSVADSDNLPLPTPELAADSSRRKKASPFAKSLRLALVAAPDMTTVKFKNPDAISANAGIMIGLPLTNRLSLVTGAVWANKVYSATPGDYNPGADYWQGKTIPTAIEARCRVLDLPLNLEYRLLQHQKSTLALQAGLSSYIMLDEKYTYLYGSGYGTYEKVWEVRNQNKHWFKVQNISVSYTYQLMPALYIGAEPFVKIPLADIGAGNVKLSSAGVFLTAGYTLPLRK